MTRTFKKKQFADGQLKSLAAKIQLNNRLLRKKRILSSDIFDEILTREKTSKGLLNKKIMIRRIEKKLE